MVRPLRRDSRGFTLVELLIVVAIIGVLSTIGVPTFRKMVTKAKKSEAKVGLGGLFTVESAFFTEYNVYGNRLDKIGYDVEGRQRLYHVGFPGDTNCGTATYAPVDGQAPGDTLEMSITGYFTDANGETVKKRQTAGGTSGAVAGTAFVCFYGAPPTGGSVSFTHNAIEVAAMGEKYVASATGNIAPGVLPTANAALGCTAATGPCQDVWLIDNQRVLSNVVDGTN